MSLYSSRILTASVAIILHRTKINIVSNFSRWFDLKDQRSRVGSRGNYLKGSPKRAINATHLYKLNTGQTIIFKIIGSLQRED